MKIVALVGSIRESSLNVKLVKTMQERYQDKFDITIFPIGELPYYNQDNEERPNEIVLNFRNEVSKADGVLVATPEYNWSIPGVLKNALDWLSRVEHPLHNKPVMIAGASLGIVGTLRAQLHLRQILSSPGISARVLPPNGNEVLINQAMTKFDESRLIDENTLEFLDGVTERFVKWINKDNQ